MSEKMNWSVLKKATAKRAGMSDKDTTLFMNAFVEVLRNNLMEGTSVRINGLGTFTPKAVAERKSVNVNTGEANTIPGYTKLSFTPETSMKDIRTRPAVNPIDQIGSQANEIMDLIGGLQDSEETTIEAEKPNEEELQISPVYKIEDEVKAEEPKATEEPKEVEKPKKEKSGSSISRPWLAASITVLTFTLMLAGGFLYAGYRFRLWVNDMHERTLPQTETIAADSATVVAEEIIGTEESLEAAATETVEKVETVEDVKPAEEVATESMPDLSKTMAWEEMGKGSRLRWVAYKYYGEKDLWVFIYEANKDQIPNPNHIMMGTKIRVPDLDRDWKNLKNAQTRQIVDSLRAIYER